MDRFFKIFFHEKTIFDDIMKFSKKKYFYTRLCCRAEKLLASNITEAEESELKRNILFYVKKTYEKLDFYQLDDIDYTEPLYRNEYSIFNGVTVQFQTCSFFSVKTFDHLSTRFTWEFCP